MKIRTPTKDEELLIKNRQGWGVKRLFSWLCKHYPSHGETLLLKRLLRFQKEIGKPVRKHELEGLLRACDERISAAAKEFLLVEVAP